jgi:hypothetical protein
MKIKKAVQKLTKELKKDPDFYFTYQSNIAMSFVDSQRWYFDARPELKHHHKLSQTDIHLIANSAAKHFLNLLCQE